MGFEGFPEAGLQFLADLGQDSDRAWVVDLVESVK